MKVRLTQLDGSMPNLALMKLAHWHRSQGDTVTLTRHIEPDLFETKHYDKVYGSAIFGFSQMRLMRFQRIWPNAIIGGTGTAYNTTIEDLIGDEYEHYDYADYPEIDYSIGFTQRGCRLKFKFCVVPKKEGKPRSLNSINEIWRGDPHPKKLHIMDNDFFGNPDWKLRINEMREGKFKVCMSQGINTRLINDESAEALATINYQNTKFSKKQLYTAWDNLGDERVFFGGVDKLERAGIPPKHLMAYMLIGYDKTETWPRIWHRFNRMAERGIMPYPMVFDRSRKDLTAFQRWVITGIYRHTPFEDYQCNLTA